MSKTIESLLTEFVGTFIFVSVILITGNPLLIALSLLIVIYLGLAYSGSNFNPAVSTAMYLKGTLNLSTYLQYIIVQLLGGVSAYYCYKYLYLRK
jgi:aquaporin Z